MQTWKFFHEYSHGDLTAKVLSLETFVLYGIYHQRSTVHSIFQYFKSVFLEVQNKAIRPVLSDSVTYVLYNVI